MLLLVACGEKSQTLDLLTAIDKEKSDVVQELLDQESIQIKILSL